MPKSQTTRSILRMPCFSISAWGDEAGSVLSCSLFFWVLFLCIFLGVGLLYRDWESALFLPPVIPWQNLLSITTDLMSSVATGSKQATMDLQHFLAAKNDSHFAYTDWEKVIQPLGAVSSRDHPESQVTSEKILRAQNCVFWGVKLYKKWQTRCSRQHLEPWVITLG